MDEPQILGLLSKSLYAGLHFERPSAAPECLFATALESLSLAAVAS